MNASLITTRVADLVRNPDAAMPSEWERTHSSHSSKQPVDVSKAEPVKIPAASSSKVKNIELSSGDYLSLSPLAQKILEESDSFDNSEWEKSRNERVQRIQQLMQDRQYSLHPDIVDGIAHKIVAMLP